MKTKVRFNLGRGKNYLKWKVWNKDECNYYPPEDIFLLMFGVELKNRPNVAKKIFEGEHKTVCAWVECESVKVISNSRHDKYSFSKGELVYNPKKNPHWTKRGDESSIDNHKYEGLITVNREIHII